MRGNPLSSDAKDRWDAICRVAGEIGMKIDPELTVQIDTDDPTPMLGYPFTKQLLARNKPFTALFAYNDMSAIGAIRALQKQGLRVPQDVSVIGLRRHSGSCVLHSEFDHGATAVEPDGRRGCASVCWNELKARRNILLTSRLNRN